MKKLFGTDGIRSRAGDFPLDERTVEIIGNSLARQFTEMLGRSPRFVTGRDTRESGAWIERAFARGANAAQADCESAAIITTPGVAYLTKKFNFDAGVVVSASHNPFEDNGIKIFLPDGKKVDETIEREIERDIFQSAAPEVQNLLFDAGAPTPQGKLTPEMLKRIEMLQMKPDDLAEYVEQEVAFSQERAAKMQDDYLDHLAQSFQTLDLGGYKIVLDCANGAASRLAPPLFRRFGAEVVAVNDQPDGVNINENCGSLHLENLRQAVLTEKADFGAAFDGDADRVLFVNEKGDIVDGDQILWIMANRLQMAGALTDQTVVATVMSNIGLELALAEKNIRLLRTDVGDKYVLARLLKTGAAIGGEQSGHIIFPQHSLIGDGMLTALFTLEAARAAESPFSALTAGFVRYPQVLVNVKVAQKPPFETVAEITEAAAEIERELGGKGRLLLRYSGTENLARVMIEGENQTAIEAQANRLANLIGNALRA